MPPSTRSRRWRSAPRSRPRRALYAHYQLQVSPPLFSVIVSITVIIMVYVGGIGSIYGAAVGAILLTLLTEMLRGFGEYRLWIYTLTLMLICSSCPTD